MRNMTIQQLGQYVFDLGFILGWFHTAVLQKLSSFFQSLGLGLESGQGSFTVKVGNAQQIGQYIGDLGFIFNFFKFLSPVAGFVVQLGADLAAGMGTFGPVRVGAEGISGSVISNGDGSDTITFTIAAWA
jgi:hypothetical protein